jgi:hypothetical protein
VAVVAAVLVALLLPQMVGQPPSMLVALAPFRLLVVLVAALATLVCKMEKLAVPALSAVTVVWRV